MAGSHPYMDAQSYWKMVGAVSMLPDRSCAELMNLDMAGCVCLTLMGVSNDSTR